MYNTEEPYHCSFCVRDREEELRIADGDLKALKEHRKSKVAQRIISLLFVTAVTRIRFRKVKKSVAYIQAFHRCSLSNKYFKRWRNEQMRPVSIEFTSFPSWFSKGTVIVTLIDHVKHVQLLRCEKEISPSFTEGILVPGISSSASLVISLAFGQTIMGQAVMSLRDVTILQHESYKFAISPKITWYPVDFKGATEIWSTSNVGEGEKESFVSFDYKPFSPTNSACMSVLGQPIDFLRKAGDQKDMKKTAQKKRNTRYWMLLAKTDLVLYSYYGDPIPRVTSNISDMNCSLANTGKLMSVHHADKRNWTFEFENGGQSELFVWKAKQAQAQHQYSLDSEPQSGQDVHRRPFNYFLMK
jgi:hypothetical protein